jgi:hypothetical protein
MIIIAIKILNDDGYCDSDDIRISIHTNIHMNDNDTLMIKDVKSNRSISDHYFIHKRHVNQFQK